MSSCRASNPSRRALIGAVSLLALAVAGCGSTSSQAESQSSSRSEGQKQASSYNGCDDYRTQARAQSAWESAGSAPASADGDGDGKVCESLPRAIGKKDSNGCKRSRSPVVVRLDDGEYPHITSHLLDAQRSGSPQVLHLDRDGATQNREQSLSNWEKSEGTKYGEADRAGKDRDEYPPAVSREGGYFRRDYASVRLVDSSENRSAGSALGLALRPYCDRQAFLIRVR